MELQKDSKLVRWTYFLDRPHDPPTQTTLCNFFWRAFIGMPLFWLVVVVFICWLVIGFSILSWKSYRVLPAVLISVFVYCKTRLKEYLKRTWSNAERTVFVQGLKTVKGNICPLIEIK